jgi:hypothetical protein
VTLVRLRGSLDLISYTKGLSIRPRCIGALEAPNPIAINQSINRSPENGLDWLKKTIENFRTGPRSLVIREEARPK